MDAHHKWGPSSAPRVAACTGSTRMQSNLPEPRVETDDADRGTELHKYMEGTERPDDLSLSDQEALDFVRGVELSIFMPEIEVFSETRVDIYCGFDLLTFGTVDAYQIVGDKIIAIDYKFGHKSVPLVADNWQCTLYAAGLLQKHKDVKTVEFNIAQPALYVHDSHTFTRQSSDEAVSEYSHLCNKTEWPNVTLSAGDHCTYCNALPICPAAANLWDFEMDGTRGDIDRYNGRDRLVEAGVAANFAKIIKVQLKELLESGIEIDGVVIKDRAGNRYIEDVAMVRLAVEHTLNNEATEELMKLGVADLEKAFVTEIKKRHGEVKIKAAKEMFQNVTGTLIKRKDPSRVLTLI